jgi:hypothetical protein
MSLPPISVYPLAIDSDYTLFQVYNTSEARISENNEAWAEEINIVPVSANKSEIWAFNGFANLDGELFYYDSVDLDSNGKVYRLKRCVRNLAGDRTHFNEAGIWVRGFVIAEHHNQLVDAIIEIEKMAFALKNALDALDLPECTDDFNCVDVTFYLDTLTTTMDPCVGTTISYNVVLNGNVEGVVIDFGDGSTSSDLIGTHIYAPNTIIDPVVTVQNGDCVVVQTPTTKTTEKINEPTIQEPYLIPIPDIPAFPPINIGDIIPPSNNINLPPIVFPCLESLGGFPSIYISMNINILSVISVVIPEIPPISFVPFPSIPPISINISIVVPSIVIPDIPPISIVVPIFPPIDINISPIDVNVNANVNVNVNVVESIPRVINISPAVITIVGPFPPLPTQINIVGNPNIPAVISFGPAPTLSVVWGTPPSITCNCAISVVCPTRTTPLMAAAMNYDDYFEDSFDTEIGVTAQSSALGIPSEIKIIPPDMPDIQIKHDLPTSINLNVPSIPDIRIIGPDKELPTEIRILGGIPSTIQVQSDIPEVISIDASGLPDVIYLQPVKNFPTTLYVDASGIPNKIQVVGIPDIIELKHNLPDHIDLKLPENLEIPLVYRGSPVQIELTMPSLVGSGDADQPCFMLVPCPRK